MLGPAGTCPTPDQPAGPEPSPHPRHCAELHRLRALIAAGEPASPPASLVHDIAAQIRGCCGHSGLKAHRLAHGWTVREAIRQLADACPHKPARGICERSWRKWEAGSTIPDIDYQDRLSRLFAANVVLLGFAADYTPRATTPR